MQLGTIQNKIYEIRGQKVMMDRDLAAMYGVETRVLKPGGSEKYRSFSF